MGVRGMWGVIAATVVVSACSSTVSTTSSLPSATSTTTSKILVASTTTVVPVASSTTLVETTTTTEVVNVLLPANDVEGPLEAIVAISDYFSYLFTIPAEAPKYLDLIYATTCNCYDVVLDDLAQYAANGWVQDDGGILVTDAFVSQEFDNGDVLLQVTDSWTPQYVIDSSNDRVRLVDDEWENVVSLIGLEIGADGRWRIGVIGVIGESNGSSG